MGYLTIGGEYTRGMRLLPNLRNTLAGILRTVILYGARGFRVTEREGGHESDRNTLHSLNLDESSRGGFSISFYVISTHCVNIIKLEYIKEVRRPVFSKGGKITPCIKIAKESN